MHYEQLKNISLVYIVIEHHQKYIVIDLALTNKILVRP